MALEVTLVKTPGNIVLPRNNHIFDQRGGTFGRADSNTWVLPDPDKFLSSCHCEILFADNQFYLEDKSTNGTFINGGFEPLGRGTRHQLRDGDFFEIGDYRFAIQIAKPHQSEFASPFDIAPVAAISASHHKEAIFDNVSKDDFFGQSVAGTPSLFDQQQDPLALWDKHPRSNSSPFEQPQHLTQLSGDHALLDDFVGIDKPASSDSFSSMSLAPGIDQAVSWPSAKTESLIPEDWADDLMSPIIDTSPKSVSANAIPEIEDLSPFALKPEIATSELPFEVPKPNVRIPLAERILGMEAGQEMSRPPQQSSSAMTLDVKSPTANASIVEVRPPIDLHSQAQADKTASVSATEASPDRVLIEALGLDISRLTSAEMVEISRVTGVLMREIVDGMLGVLRSRASIKNEFRMNVTTIQPIENNPLKFSVCVDDALENLFIKKSNAYKKPVEAFREGFQEIAEHQLAMIAGIRQGFEAMMERFDPEQLEKTFNKQVKGSVIPGMQKAKFWTSYTEYYQGFTDNMEFSFQHLFGSDFVTAYEDQLRRLTAARKRGDAHNE